MVEGISGSPAPAGLVEKVKAILLKPKEEWPKIAADPATPGDIVTRYAIPLIAIGPVASFIGGQVFGYSAFFVQLSPGLMVAGLPARSCTFVMSLVVLLAVTLIAEFLAPKFGGEANRRQALQVGGLRSDRVVGRRHLRARFPRSPPRLAGRALQSLPVLSRRHAGDESAGGQGDRLHRGHGRAPRSWLMIVASAIIASVAGAVRRQRGACRQRVR